MFKVFKKIRRKAKKFAATMFLITTVAGTTLSQALPTSGSAALTSNTVSDTPTDALLKSDNLKSLTSTIQTEMEKIADVVTLTSNKKSNKFEISKVPPYTGSPYVEINDNTPYFTKKEITDKSFEKYSPLDELGRCGACTASLSLDTMPTGKRGDISSIKPTGWNQASYKGVVQNTYLYNRCHLIGWQLSAENKNKKNLITGTRYFNVEGMLPFENMVADYIHETSNHVMYRVTPIFVNKNLLASGVLIEAYSVEDDGEGICFCVYVYNVQPKITINYKDGSSKLTKDKNSSEGKKTSSAKKTTKETPKKDTKKSSGKVSSSVKAETSETVWVSETGSKYHRRNNCGRMNPAKATSMSRANAEKYGYEPCKKCY